MVRVLLHRNILQGKVLNELEQEDPINKFRPVNVMRVKRNFNQLEYGNNPMKIGSDQNKEFIPLYSTKYQREYPGRTCTVVNDRLR